MVDFGHIRIVPDLEIYPGGCEYHGRQAKLSAPQNTFLTVLRDNYPALTSTDDLMDAIYGHGDNPESQATNIYACKVRAKLKPLGINVETVWGCGYRLNYAP